MKLKAARVSFTCSQRAVVRDRVQPYHQEVPAMPMIGRTRVDKKMWPLFQMLASDKEITLEGDGQSRVKVLYNGKTCQLPAHYEGQSMESEIRRRLREIGIEVARDTVIPPPGAVYAAFGTTVDAMAGGPTSPISPAEMELAFGVAFSEHTVNILMGLMESAKKDISESVKTRIKAAVDETIEELAGDDKSADVERLERELEKQRTERNNAVADLVRQRDDFRDQRDNLEAELHRMRTGLKLLGITLPEKVDA